MSRPAVAIPEKLFDPAGVSAARITDRALSRGWEPDGFIRVLDFRLYRFRAIGSQPNKPFAADRA